VYCAFEIIHLKRYIIILFTANMGQQFGDPYVKDTFNGEDILGINVPKMERALPLWIATSIRCFWKIRAALGRRMAE